MTSLQQMVNTLQVERDALAQEFHQARQAATEDVQASGQETSGREAGEFISRISRSCAGDAQARPQQRDVVVSRLSTGTVAKRFDACDRA